MLLTGSFLSSCSSSQKEEATTQELSGGRSIDLQSNNVFAWKKDDVQRGENQEITGGKRSQFDKKAAAALGKKNGKAPDYYSRKYHSKAWTGRKDYSKGSYKTDSWNGGKTSRFAGKSSRESGRQSRASGKGYQTGAYRTGSARETSAKAIKRSQSSYHERRSGFKPPIYDMKDYRKFSIGQTRSLLGKD